MESYLNIANSSFIFKIGAVVVAFVFIQAIILLRAAWKEGLRIGIDKKVLWDTVKSSAVFSVVPSLPILISLIAMAPVLGVPFPWIRLSIIGSAPYELMSANIGAQSMGVSGLGGAGYTAEVFANSMWVMSVGIIWGLLICVLFLKKIQNKMGTLKQKDSAWTAILISALYFGMLSVFIGQPVVEGGVPLATTITGGAIMIGLTYLIKKYEIKWLNNFALAISMIGAMGLSIFYTNIM
ncbi:DUF5058 family protein [Serpentinicella sp. ANB-PHB4]|uniref:DUF5058 family protein n=1 Tax=Serpentinicella sp. ANB-PHB4 TaxID=3074076 RepID=UPI00286557B7|nr:DUF5058 family protein [Serpentinicella sp. ANB-PHB4]MDR5658846.1 DUF5058 family protein [Serpentinicella sp. ANB-PHB4]